MKFFLSILIFSLFGFANGTIINVPTDIDSIQGGINQADHGDTVLVQPGTYMENIEFNGKSIVVGSLYLIDHDTSNISGTIIDGGGSDVNQSAVNFVDGETNLSTFVGFTITNGWASGSHGGGITLKNNSNPVIEDCWIMDNTGTSSEQAGMGIYCSGSSPTFSRCLIKNNSVSGNGNYYHRGGGLYVAASSAPIFSDCEFIDNKMADAFYRDWGGAVSSNNSSPQFTNCLFRGNSAVFGGAIDCYNNSNIQLKNCIFFGNSSNSLGGVIRNHYNSTVHFDSCLMYQNSAGDNGGAIYSDGGQVTVLKSTLTENSAQRGAGVFSTTTNSVILTDCIVFYNWFNEIYPSNLDSVTYCNVRGGYPGTGNVDFDPLFCDWQSNDYQLAANSICLSFGSSGGQIGYFGSGCSAIYSQTRRVPADYATIQEAINASYQRDTIWVANNTYTENIQFFGRRILLTSNYHTTKDTSDISNTIIDGGGSGINQSVVSFIAAEDNSTLLKGFTITNGWASGSHGGGITLKNGSDPVIEDCWIKDNTGTSSEQAGMGIYCSGSSPTFSRCLIKNNSVSGNGNYYHWGGGLYVAAASAPKFNDCDFIDNKMADAFYRDWGGAVSSNNSSPQFTNCLFSGNSAVYGGAIDCYNNSDIQLKNCNFIGNSSNSLGGVIRNHYNSTVRLDSCLMYQNSAGDNGGAIYSDGGQVTVLKSTLTENSAQRGAGVFSTTTNSVILSDCIVFYNWFNEIYPSTLDSVTYCDVRGGYPGTGNVDFDPRFCDWQNNDFQLAANSICLTSGSGGGQIGYFGSGCSAIYPQTRRVPADYTTIQEAINASYQRDTVLVANNTYTENIQFLGRRILLTSNYFTTKDTSDISNTIIDGGGSDINQSVVSFIAAEDTLTMLKGFTITNGWASGEHGGGITLKNGSNPVIEDCWIKDNTGTSSEQAGMGIYCSGSSPTFTRCLIKNNSVSGNGNYYHRGGGLYVAAASAPKFYDCDFIDNKMADAFYRDWGGAVSSNNSSPQFTNCLFRGNSAVFGGAIDIRDNSNVKINNCQLSENNASADGGAISCNNSRLHLNNSLLIYNHANSEGGGIYLYGQASDSSLLLFNNTISKNSASASGGGIYCSNASPVIINTIVWEDTAADGSEIFVESGTPEIAYSDIRGGWAGTGNLDTDPLFTDTLSFFLSDISPCIDTGHPDSQFNDTEDPLNSGFALRPAMGALRSDIGAYGGPGVIDWNVVTNLKDDQLIEEIPIKFNLFQNYPNPFNPLTSIEYQLPGLSEVELTIYNIVGQKVATLVSESQPMGKYKINWDATNFASGIYFYRLHSYNISEAISESFTMTKKLMLIK